MKFLVGLFLLSVIGASADKQGSSFALRGAVNDGMKKVNARALQGSVSSINTTIATNATNSSIVVAGEVAVEGKAAGTVADEEEAEGTEWSSSDEEAGGTGAEQTAPVAGAPQGKPGPVKKMIANAREFIATSLGGTDRADAVGGGAVVTVAEAEVSSSEEEAGAETEEEEGEVAAEGDVLEAGVATEEPASEGTLVEGKAAVVEDVATEAPAAEVASEGGAAVDGDVTTEEVSSSEDTAEGASAGGAAAPGGPPGAGPVGPKNIIAKARDFVTSIFGEDSATVAPTADGSE